MIHGRMRCVVARIVSQRPEGERVFVNRLRFSNQRRHEVARADVMHEVCKESTAERVVAEVLNERTTIGVRARLLHRLRGRTRKSAFEQRHDLIRPPVINQGLVRENRVSRGNGR
jgi:hypothetical protein